MANSVLTLQNVTKTYGSGQTALQVLRGVNLDIREGEIVALVGPSGCGKTTLLQIAGLLDLPGSGSVSIIGQDMSAAKDAARTKAREQHIGFVYQFHHLLPEFTALENVVLPQLIAGKKEKAAVDHAKSLLQGLGLEPRWHHMPSELSGGEQQRVAIARALSNSPQLLIADEPTGNLDPETAEGVFAHLLETCSQKGLAILMATHNMELAGKMSRTVRLYHGKL